MQQPLTPRQLEVFEFIVDYSEEHGHQPSRREMAIALNLSETRIAQHVKTLKEYGWISFKPSQPRSITVIGRTIH